MPSIAPLLAEGPARTVLDWGGIESPLDLLAPLLAVLLLAVLVRLVIRADTRGLSPLAGWTLTALRLAVLLGLLVVFLEPEWRSQREVVRNSRALLLIDTSSSMGLEGSKQKGEEKGGAGEGQVASGKRRVASDKRQVNSAAGHLPLVTSRSPLPTPDSSTRLGQVTQALDEGRFLQELRKTHDVVVLRFDEELRRVATLEKGSGEWHVGNGEAAAAGDQWQVASEGAGAAGGSPHSSLATRHSSLPTAHSPVSTPLWGAALAPTGNQTRLGQALRELIQTERESPVSGIVVFTDGGQNAGISPEEAIEAARTARIPIFTVGVGPLERAPGVRVASLEVPSQAHPGDPYVVTGLVQSQGLAGQTVSVELLVRDASEDAAGGERGSGVPVRREQVILGADGEAVPVKFELTPTDTGRQVICLRVQPPASDADPQDDFLEEEIDVVDRKIRVLLFAGGPSREYRFLRTLLYRDASVTVDVLLQTARPGISQEADRILNEFPLTREEMYEYDCVIAMDPNWRTLTPGQVDLLETWVAEQGGGLIAAAGPIHAGESVSGWVQDPAMARIRALYPVEFRRQLTVFEGGMYAGSEPWPLDFTRDGLQAEFLWLDDSASASQRAWAEFPGVYSFLPVRGPKPGAAVLARFSDPRAGRSESERVYFAEQFYGSGRVFYEGSAEMWRLRGLGDDRFERFYTRLVRHVSQGRVLRQSSRGALWVDRDRYMLGETVQIRARLAGAQLAPLAATQVTLNAIKPGGDVETVTLRAEPDRPGMFAGQLTVLGEGTYRLELPVPESDERLSRRIKVSLPDLERHNPQRNDKLLSRIAQATGGKYYQELSEAVDPNSADPLVGRLKDRTQTIIQSEALQPPSLRWLLRQVLPGGLWRQRWFAWLADESWLGVLLDRTLIWWLMVVLCGLLCCEWLIRRLSRLA